MNIQNSMYIWYSNFIVFNAYTYIYMDFQLYAYGPVHEVLKLTAYAQVQNPP